MRSLIFVVLAAALVSACKEDAPPVSTPEDVDLRDQYVGSYTANQTIYEDDGLTVVSESIIPVEMVKSEEYDGRVLLYVDDKLLFYAENFVKVADGRAFDIPRQQMENYEIEGSNQWVVDGRNYDGLSLDKMGIKAQYYRIQNGLSSLTDIEFVR
ncbi:MAG: hypothetical protein JJ975_08400 [Bacteroidia bacterium]|nr:hypothetical protein [Bacteroidia bacterium]